MKKPARSGFRVEVIRQLRGMGFSARQAEKAVNAIFDSMRDGVKRGELVETPFGLLNRTLVRRKQRVMRNPFTGKVRVVGDTSFWRFRLRRFPKDRG